MANHLTSASAQERSMNVLRAMRDLTKVQDPTALIEFVLDQVIRTLDAERAFVSYEEPDGQQVIVARNFANVATAGREYDAARSIVRFVYATGEPTLTTQVQGDEGVVAAGGTPSAKPRMKSVAWLPLKMLGQPFGVLHVETTRRDCPFGEDDRVYLEALADQAAVVISNARLHRDAVRDSLTGLVFHRYFDVRLAEEMSRALRWKRPLSLLMLDVDHFKLINDRYGHPMGNNILRTLASLLRVILRESDVPGRVGGTGPVTDLAGRFGGDEFEVLLPETGREGTRVVAERILHAVRGMEFGDEGKIRITVSIGASTCPDDGREREELALKADEALYIAKRAGRDQLAFPEGTGGGGEIVARPAPGHFAPEVPLSRDALRIVRLISHAIEGGLGRGPMLDLVLRQTADAVGCERGLVLLAQGAAAPATAAAFGVDREAYAQAEFEDARALVSEVVTTGIPRIARNALADPSAVPRRTLLAFPIRGRSGIHGALYLERASARPPLTDDDLNLATTLAGKLGAHLTETAVP